MEKLTYEKKNRIAYITLNRPEALNALDEELNRELEEVWDDFALCSETDIVIITGAGKSFCAGADLKTFIPKWKKADLYSLRQNAQTGLAGGITRGKHRIYKPVIAAVNGHAIGAGFELALACDIRIASEKAKFGVFETRYGLHQGDGGLVRLCAIAGTAVAADLSMTGREVSAEEALKLGLVSRVVPAEELMKTAEEYAGMILKNSQRAVRSVKETIINIQGCSFDDALRLEAINGYSCLGDFSEAEERLKAFIKKQ